ncbi:MAG: hypothetical protein ACFFD4_30720 [Candidatus Odinarchaeota archaeon]
MNDKKEVPSAADLVEQLINKKVEDRVTLLSKGKALAIYKDLLLAIHSRILPTLGQVAVTAIFNRALALTEEKYPLSSHLVVNSNGISFENFSRAIAGVENDIISETLKEFVTNIADILTMLTGDILVARLLTEIEADSVADDTKQES